MYEAAKGKSQHVFFQALECDLHSHFTSHPLVSLVHVCACARVRLSYSQVLQKPTAEQKQQLAAHSKHVAACVTELVQTAEAMKGEATRTHTADAHGHTLFHSTHKQKFGLTTFSYP